MNKIKSDNYICRMICLILFFLIISYSISCSNVSNSNTNIKEFRIINNETLISLQLINYIGDFKISTLRIKEGEAITPFDSSHTNSSSIIYKKMSKFI